MIRLELRKDMYLTLIWFVPKHIGRQNTLQNEIHVTDVANNISRVKCPFTNKKCFDCVNVGHKKFTL